jgi:hypothetical protein
MDIHKSCGVTVFENEEQSKSCANSSTVKQGVAFMYAIYGFFITLILCAIIYFSVRNTNNVASVTNANNGASVTNANNVASVTNTYNNILLLVFGISIIGITFLSYNYGYATINNDSVMQVYNQDQTELNSRSASYTSREANVADLIKDRQQTEAAYIRGNQNNFSNQNNSRYGTNINFGTGINYNSRNGFGIRF